MDQQQLQSSSVPTEKIEFELPSGEPLPRMTRKQALAFLRSHGYPIGASSFAKFCSKCVGGGPEPCGIWGRRPLYEPKTLLLWAEARLKPAHGAQPDESSTADLIQTPALAGLDGIEPPEAAQP